MLLSQSTAALTQPRFTNPNKVMRGIDFFEPFGNGSTSGGHYPSNVWTGQGPVFSGVMPTAKMNVLTAAGFDFVRFHILTGVLMDGYSQGGNATLDARINDIITGVSSCVSNGLKVIVNLDPTGGPSLSAYSDVNCLSGSPGATSAVWQLYCYCAARMASAIESLNKSGWVALELFNEPPQPGSITGSTWPVYLAELLRQVRLVATRTTLIVAGTGYANADGTIIGVGANNGGAAQLDFTTFDKNTIVVLHGYDAATIITLQTCPGTTYEQAAPLYYPASAQPGGKTQALSDLLASLDAALAGSAITQQQHDDRKAELYTSSNGDSYNYWFDNGLGTATYQTARFKILTDKADAAGLSRRALGDSEVGITWNNAGATPQQSAHDFIQARYDRYNAAGAAFICVHTGGGPGQDLTGAQGICVQSGNSPYGFAPWLLSALRLA